MRWQDYLILGVLGFVTTLAVGLLQTTPGYMDAEYYFSNGLRLAGGHGFSELIIWNFLDDPQGLPHASHAYWMPLASIVSWLGIALAGSDSYAAGRSVFLLLAGFIPPLTSALSYRLLAHRRAAWLAGILAVFPVFYLPYFPTTDTFVLSMLLGASWVWLAAGYPLFIGSYRIEGRAFAVLSALALGVVCGLMHLSRADGLVWLFLALGSIVIWRVGAKTIAAGTGTHSQNAKHEWKTVAVRTSLCLLGYLVVMAPWLVRNLAVYGSPLAPGGIKALWFIDYDDLYIYPASLLTPQRWWESGMAQIAWARLWALGQNLQTTLAVQGGIALAPLVIWGLWRCRKQRAVQIGLAAWMLVLVVMTLPFPFAGGRGGFFHSGAALQPLFWAVIPAGLQGFIDWGVRIRGWQARRAGQLFAFSVLVLALILSGIIVASRVLGQGWRQPVWDASSRQYAYLGDEINALGADGQAVVLVNNPPGMFLSSGRPAVSIPDGGQDSLLAVAEKYHASYLILESNHPAELDFLYQHPDSQGDLRYIKTIAGAHLFEFQND